MRPLKGGRRCHRLPTSSAASAVVEEEERKRISGKGLLSFTFTLCFYYEFHSLYV